MKFSIITIFLISTVFLLSCGPDPSVNPTPAQSQMEKLTGSYSTSSSKTWSVSSVYFETSEDRTSEWTSFALTLSTDGSGSGTYTSTSGVAGGPWPASGSWSFGGTTEVPDITTLIRDDGLSINIIVNASSSPNTLTMTFTFDENTHQTGKIDAVSGEYVFTMTGN